MEKRFILSMPALLISGPLSLEDAKLEEICNNIETEVDKAVSDLRKKLRKIHPKLNIRIVY